MVSDTLRQKFIYNTPFNDEEFPLVALDEEINLDVSDCFKINASYLYFLEEDDFLNILNNIKTNYILIINDYDYKTMNRIIINGSLCHIVFDRIVL